MKVNKIIISRTDSIGDVVLTLPVAGVLKKYNPKCEIYFLGKSYTRDIVSASENVDHFINWDKIKDLDSKNQIQEFEAIKADIIVHVFPVKEIAVLARKAKIPFRIGTTGRLYHYLNCNKLVPLSRKRSPLHESQLNLMLIKPLLEKKSFGLDEIPEYYGFKNVDPLNQDLKKLLSNEKFNLVLHPKSKGSAREWGQKNFGKLIEILPKDKFEIFITGTLEEGKLIKEDILDRYPEVQNLTGKLILKQLMSFINQADGIVAASTGPLHIASALGKIAIGIYPPIKPMHPGRWAPVGEYATYIVEDKDCSKCRKTGKCECMESISPEIVKNKLLSFVHD